MTFTCNQCLHRIENSSGAYGCETCPMGICRLCFLGLSAHCFACGKNFGECEEKIEEVKYRKFFCTLCFKEKYIKNGVYQCPDCWFSKICLNCRSILTNEKKVTSLPKNISVFEYQRFKEETGVWEEFKEGFFRN